MKKQYIILAVSIVLLAISIIFIPILGEILFIPFIFVFQYTCRSSNRRESNQQQIEQPSQSEPSIPLKPTESKKSDKELIICEMCGAKITKRNLRYCESCGMKLRL